MNQWHDGTIIGKAQSFEEAALFMKNASKHPSIVCSSYVIYSYKSVNNSWELIQSCSGSVSTKIWCCFDEDDIKHYISVMGDKVLTYSGGFSIMDSGMQYVKKIEGSYSAIIGLPLCEVRYDLKKMGFM
jgi:septum formation protein